MSENGAIIDLAARLAALEFVRPEDDDSIFSGLVAIGVRPSDWHADLETLRAEIALARAAVSAVVLDALKPSNNVYFEFCADEFGRAVGPNVPLLTADENGVVRVAVNVDPAKTVVRVHNHTDDELRNLRG